MFKFNSESGIWFVIQPVFSAALQFLFISLLATEFSSLQLGVFFLCSSYALFAGNSLNFGLLLGYERNFFEREQNQFEETSALVTLVLFNLIIGISVVSISIYFLKFFNVNLNVSLLLLYLMCVGYILSVTTQIIFVRCKNKGNSLRYFILCTLQPLLNLILLIILVEFKSEFDPDHIPYVSFLFSWIITFFIIFCFEIKPFLPFKLDYVFLLNTLRVSLPMTPRLILGSANSQIDKVFIGSLISPSVLAVYGILQLIASTIFQLMTALSKKFQPRLYRILFSRINESESLCFIQKSFLFVLIYSLFLAAFCDVILDVFYSKEYAQYFKLEIMLVFIYTTLFLGKISGIQLIFSKQALQSTVIIISGGVINVLALMLLKNIGIFGVICAFGLSQIAMLALSIYFSQASAPLLINYKYYILQYISLAFALILLVYSITYIDDIFLLMAVRFFIVVLGSVSAIAIYHKFKN